MRRIEELHLAQVNRSIRTIKAELEYLCDAGVITPQTLSELLERVPPQTALHAPISVGAVPSAEAAPTPLANLHNLNINPSNNARANGAPSPSPLNEKGAGQQAPPSSYYAPHNAAPASQQTPNAAQPPPQASWSAAAPPLATATALYAYSSTDEGDLELQPNDSIAVTAYLNAEWWKGRNARTGLEGIFPRSYVKVEEEKGLGHAPVGAPEGYGSAQSDPSMMDNGVNQGQVQGPSKFEQQGKKFGKKLGNAAIFGAGFSIGGDIVNAIL